MNYLPVHANTMDVTLKSTYIQVVLYLSQIGDGCVSGDVTSEMDALRRPDTTLLGKGDESTSTVQKNHKTRL